MQYLHIKIIFISSSLLLEGSNGSIVFTNLIPRRYTLRIEAQNLNEDPVILRRQLEISSDPQYCTLHFINGGVTVNCDQRTAVVEFVKNGPVTSFNCQLDRQGFFPCKMMSTKLLSIRPASRAEMVETVVVHSYRINIIFTQYKVQYKTRQG